MNYIFFCDSPTLETGFARVSKNVIPRLNLGEKHVWALGYQGEAHNYDFNLYQANVNSNWADDFNRTAFRRLMDSLQGPKTIWTLHDPFRLSAFKDELILEKNRGSRIVSYVPVDSPLAEEDKKFLELCDLIVVYNKYGAKEIKRILPNKKTIIIPHGFDPDFKKRESRRQEIFPNTEDKKLIGVVNSNTERKALHRSLEILKELIKIKDEYIMYLHTPLNGFYDLVKLIKQLKLENRVIVGNEFFEGARIGKSHCDKNSLVDIYNCFDLFLSTSFGEGWGLTVSEAACCEVPICIPKHTAFEDLYIEESALWMDATRTTYSQGKIVPDIDPVNAATLIIILKKNQN